MNPEQKSREGLVKTLRDRARKIEQGTFTSMDATWMRQAANEIETLGPIAEAAKDVWAVGNSKGQLFSSDEQESDHLVGFFLPEWVFIKLGRSFGAAVTRRRGG